VHELVIIETEIFKIILKFITVLDLCIKHFVNCCLPVYLISEIVSNQRNRCFYF